MTLKIILVENIDIKSKYKYIIYIIILMLKFIICIYIVNMYVLLQIFFIIK
jgi:hypothetical protein